MSRICSAFSVRSGLLALTVGIVCGGVLAEVASGDEWSRFRGPNGGGIGAGRVPTEWSDADYNWRVDLPGVGHSSPVIWGDRIFLTSGDEESAERIVACYSTAGKAIWQRRFAGASHRKHKLNSYASTTPAVDGERLYLGWGTPDDITLLALNHAGEEVWRVGLGPFKAGHGFGVSPIVYRDAVILPIEHGGDSFLVALDSATGEQRWKSPRDSKLHYSTPCVLSRDGHADQLVFTNWEQGICGVDPVTGKTLWQTDVFDKGHIESSISSPVVHGNLVVGICGWLGYGKQAVAVRVDGRDSVREVWRLDKGVPLCTTPLIVGDLFFMWADEGIVTCADLQTGEVQWKRRVSGTFYASPVAVGDRIYNISAAGEMYVIAADRKYKLLGRNTLPESSHSTPACGHDRMYIRTFSQLLSLGG